MSSNLPLDYIVLPELITTYLNVPKYYFDEYLYNEKYKQEDFENEMKHNCGKVRLTNEFINCKYDCYECYLHNDNIHKKIFLDDDNE